MQLAPKPPVIRRASLDDLRSIFEIDGACSLAAHWSESHYRDVIQQRTRLTLVADDNGNVIAFLVASTATEEWELENIAVAPRLQRKGVGRALMKALIDHAQGSNASEIRQEIRASNLAAHRLGQSMGFVQEGRRKNYYHDPSEDALLFKYLVPGRECK